MGFYMNIVIINIMIIIITIIIIICLLSGPFRESSMNDYNAPQHSLAVEPQSSCRPPRHQRMRRSYPTPMRWVRSVTGIPWASAVYYLALVWINTQGPKPPAALLHALTCVRHALPCTLSCNIIEPMFRFLHAIGREQQATPHLT